MTEADDNVVGLPDLDRLFEEVLAGEIGTPDAPAWRNDLARLVHGARAEAAPDELAAQDDIVRRMTAIRQAVDAGDQVAVGGRRANPTPKAPTSRATPAATGPSTRGPACRRRPTRRSATSAG